MQIDVRLRLIISLGPRMARNSLSPSSETTSSVDPVALGLTQRKSVAALTALLVAQGTAAIAAPSDAGDDAADGSQPTKLDRVLIEESKGKALASPKFTEPLRDTPQTVVVVPQIIIEQQGATNLSDVLRNTPGITFLAGEGGGASGTAGDAFYMRGFDASNSIFVDGVRDTGAYSRDVFNLEQVEIAKGPAGADNGRGATSGYVNLASKTPRLNAFNRATVSYGSEEHKRVTADVNAPLTDSPIQGTAFRLNLLYQDGGVAGRDWAEQNRWGVSPSLALGLGTPTQVTLSYQYVDQDNLPDYGMPSAALPGLLQTTPPTGSVSQKNFYGLVNADFEDVTNEVGTVHVQHEFNPDVRLTNQTRYSQTNRSAEITTLTGTGAYVPATGLVTRSRQRNERETNIFSNQTNVTAHLDTGTVRHTVTSGLELSREKANSPGWTGLGTVEATNIYQPTPTSPVVGYAPVHSGASTNAQTDTAALYAFDTLKLNPAWQLSGGVRAERYEIKYHSVPATGSTTAPAQLRVKDDLVTWKLGVVYKPVHAGSLYASVGTSLRPPGTNLSLSTTATNADNPGLDPQEATNFEVGAKWDFAGGKLSTTAALFRSENKNVPTSDSVTGNVIQAVDQTVQGVELGVSGQVTDNWILFSGVALMDSEYSAPASSAAGGNSGAELQWAPKVSGNVWSTYRLPFGLTVGGGARYMSTVARQTTNTPSASAPEMPSYWVLDAVVGYDVNRHLTLRLNLNNLADEAYSRSLNSNGGRYVPGAARSYLLTASVQF